MASKILDLIKKEEERQQNTLMMIPSENYTYPEVRRAVGSVLMHKYSEGQVGKRYYEGNSVIDEIEEYCKNLALDVFRLPEEHWGANVQALSGSPANLAVFNALLNPGDKILSLYLPDGGHLSHGWQMGIKKVTLISKIYDVHFYNVDPKTQKLNYAEIAKLAKKIKPKIIVSGGTAYPLEIKHVRFSTIAKSVGAYYLADVAHEAGLIAARVVRSPFPSADVVTMTTHKTLRGPRGAIILARRELISKINASVFPGIQGGPHNHTIAGIAVALEKTRKIDFRNDAYQTIKNAERLVKKLKENGFKIVGGGTEKHLVLVDLTNKKINGHFMARALARVGIIANKNTIPNEQFPPMYPSGLRLGTPAITARGMKYREVDKIADIINRIAKHIGKREISRDTKIRESQLEKFEDELKTDTFYKPIRKEVLAICKKYPIDLK